MRLSQTSKAPSARSSPALTPPPFTAKVRAAVRRVCLCLLRAAYLTCNDHPPLSREIRFAGIADPFKVLEAAAAGKASEGGLTKALRKALLQMGSAGSLLHAQKLDAEGERLPSPVSRCTDGPPRKQALRLRKIQRCEFVSDIGVLQRTKVTLSTKGLRCVFSRRK